MNVLIAKMSRKMLFLYTITIFLHYQPILTGAAQSGDVTIGANNVIDPTATISAENGPIRIGDNCVINQRVKIINRQSSPLIIGNNNVFNVDCHIESRKIGNNNVFGSECFIGSQVTLANDNVFGSRSLVGDRNGRVVIGSNNVINDDAQIEAPKIGDNNVFGPRCFVGNQVTVTNRCVIGAGCKVTQRQVIQEGAVIDVNQCQKVA